MSMGTSYFIRKVREMANLLVTLLRIIVSISLRRQHDHTDHQQIVVNEADDSKVPMPLAAYLPDEIMMKVLSELPVKSLVRFRCVSKPWLSLISSDRHFIKNHLLRSSSISSDDDNQRVIFINGNLDFSRGHRTCSFDSMFSHLHKKNKNTRRELEGEDDLKEPFLFPFPYGWLIGSCHGLVCLHSGDKSNTIVIWNPSLRQYKKLPPIFLNNNKYLSKKDNLYGFGYDSSIDDYKVVVMRLTVVYEEEEEGLFDFHTRFYVFTMRSNSWRRINQDYHPSYCGTGTGTTVKKERSGRFISSSTCGTGTTGGGGGALHWFITDPPSSKPLFHWCPPISIIIAFDLATETLSVVEQPSYSHQEEEEYRIPWFPQVVLGELGGCLCLMIDNHVQMHNDLWIMREYGVPNSWTKLASLPYLIRHPSSASDHHHRRYLSPYSPNTITLFVSKSSGELLVIYDYVICLYSSKLDDGEFRLLLAEKVIDNCLETAIYIDSLVSPNATVK